MKRLLVAFVLLVCTLQVPAFAQRSAPALRACTLDGNVMRVWDLSYEKPVVGKPNAPEQGQIHICVPGMKEAIAAAETLLPSNGRLIGSSNNEYKLGVLIPDPKEKPEPQP